MEKKDAGLDVLKQAVKIIESKTPGSEIAVAQRRILKAAIAHGVVDVYTRPIIKLAHAIVNEENRNGV